MMVLFAIICVLEAPQGAIGFIPLVMIRYVRDHLFLQHAIQLTVARVGYSKVLCVQVSTIFAFS